MECLGFNEWQRPTTLIWLLYEMNRRNLLARMGSDTSPVVRGIPKQWIGRKNGQDSPQIRIWLFWVIEQLLPWCNLSPSELLMGRMTRTDAPQIASQLTHQWSYLNEFKKLDKEFKEKQQFNYNLRHQTKILNPLLYDYSVWVRTGIPKCLVELYLQTALLDHTICPPPLDRFEETISTLIPDQRAYLGIIPVVISPWMIKPL